MRPAILIISAALIALCGFAFAQGDAYFDPQLTFRKATQAYSESRFDEACQEYQKILDHGYISANICYNLGNSYFKTGKLGKAIVNYERAHRLSPGDSDLKSNLEYAYSLVEESSMERSRLWLDRRIRGFLGLFTLDGLAKTLSLVYICAMIILIISIFRKSAQKALVNIAVFLGAIFLVILTLLVINAYCTENIRSAIVTDKEANARFEPFSDATVHYKLSEGLRLEVVKTRGAWSQVKREDGKVGWVENYTFEFI